MSDWFSGSLKRNLYRAFGGGHQPDFLIVGAQKSGTSSLFSYLSARDGFIGASKKEVHYFDREDNFRRGDRWYEAYFRRRRGQSGLFFEASPTYLCREKVPARLKAYKPDLKIIAILREPVSRAYSAWNMYRQWSEDGIVPRSMANDQHGREESPNYRVFIKHGCPSFSEYIDLEMDLIARGDREEEPSLLRRGLYKPQIERYVELFGRDNVLVLGFNELKHDSEAVVEKCHRFLGVPYQPPARPMVAEARNQRRYPAQISAGDLSRLQNFYAEPNQQLVNYLGFSPDW